MKLHIKDAELILEDDRWGNQKQLFGGYPSLRSSDHSSLPSIEKLNWKTKKEKLYEATSVTKMEDVPTMYWTVTYLNNLDEANQKEKWRKIMNTLWKRATN